MGKLFGKIALGTELRIQRNEILETLLRKIAELEDENAMLRLDLARTAETRDEYMADADRGATEISQLRTEIMTLLGKMSVEKPQRPIKKDEVFLNNTPFVVVLIDGIESMLMNEHVQEGEGGGRKASKRFYEHLMQYLKQRQVFQTHWRLMIKFYASMSNFGTNYLKRNIIQNLETWRNFIDGFNKEYPLCYFIDSGNDEKTAGSKIRDQIEVFFGHRDCKHTVLVGSLDGSYTGFLRQYMRKDDLCGRITVVEAVPFPGEFHDLSIGFLPSVEDSLFPDPEEHTLDKHASPKKSVSLPSQPKSNILPSQVQSTMPSPRKLFDSAVSRLQPAPSTFTPLLVSYSKAAIQQHKRGSAAPPLLDPIPREGSLPTRSLTKSTHKPSNSTLLGPGHKSVSMPKPPPATPDREPRISQLVRTCQSKSSNYSQPQTVKRKPLAEIQTRVPGPRPRNTFFDSKGQRVDSRSYVNMYTQRYLEY